MVAMLLSTWLSKASTGSLRRYLDATENRIKHISTGLPVLRAIRQVALEPAFIAETVTLRTIEISRASKYRKMEVLLVTLG